ncbi:gluconate 2-dehydrogenase subunit 3 family protein [Paraburkholderia rhizosphaerae]|uniref:Gluconate 2-dehydrogenase subunit 3-like protein n=1 Tax=Paraburkholderia rhizosphaerae TaxID=480658 RepID=A0A4R8L8H3_9BURK|nr:gluconate 2-dehydrogenase subunit 3 family protein [Paraburkholderia rhizosphaerae]TDY39047.1 gluconate 2-dehydrogenase subunit 3-like protein [Paraburkholderia rhizosphaerae]
MNDDRSLPAYPDYDVLEKRDSPSWDEATRAVIGDRIATRDEPAWCSPAEWRVLRALCSIIIPQADEPSGSPSASARQRPPVPLAALVDRKIARGKSDGYRNARLPALQQAWRIGLAAIDDESHHRYHAAFADLEEPARVRIVHAMEHGTLTRDAWQSMPSKLFFSQRVLHDICTTYYAHPSAWSDIGFGGPANPRGYVRMVFNRRDPWEAKEAAADAATQNTPRNRAPEKHRAR